jgi:hypothetical protein
MKAHAILAIGQFAAVSAAAWLAQVTFAADEPGRLSEDESKQENRSGDELPPVTIVKDGRAQIAIVAGSVREPAEELRRYLQQISGAEFELTGGDAEKLPGSALYVGLEKDFPQLKLERTDQLGPEGFVLLSDEKNVYLIANQPHGVSHAVATFLHGLGCRWFFPGETWEVIPRRATITGSWYERRTPDFATQRRIWYGYGAYQKGRQDWEAWNRHNRMGGPIEISIGHTWHGLDPERDFKLHPEWFALVDGKRQPSKPCYSDPDVLKRAIQYALKQAADGKQMISMTPPDGLGYCECERCRAVFQGGEPFEAHSTLFARRPDGQLVNITSETVFSFVNKVAAAAAEKHPRVLVGCYAYSAYSHPPSFDLHENVYLQTTTAFRRTPITLEEQLRAFGRKTHQLGIREYYSAYQWDWDYPAPGKLTPEQLQQDLRFFREHGITAVNAEASNNWGSRGLGYYVAAQLMWDVKADTGAIVRDFYQQAFGPAARVMERYYVRWYGPSAAVFEQAERLPQKQVYFEQGRHNLEALKAAYRDLDEAAGLVKAHPQHRDRIDALRMYLHYLLLRYRLQQATDSGERDEILAGVRKETVFGGRLTDTHMIHTRPLLGKAFLRRFRAFEALLEDVPEAGKPGEGWRQVGQPPNGEELERLWSEDLHALGIL